MFLYRWIFDNVDITNWVFLNWKRARNVEIFHEVNVERIVEVMTPFNAAELYDIERYALTKNAVKGIHRRKFQSLANVK